MGEDGALINLLNSSADCSDEAALRVIDPPVGDRDRGELLLNESKDIPGIAAWRKLGSSGGLALSTDAHVVRANHFRVQTADIPVKVLQYSVSIFHYKFDGSLQEQDLAKESDKRVNVTLVRLMRDKNPEWRTDAAGRRVGIAYDGNSTLYATSPLPCIPGELRADSSAKYQEDVYWPGSTTNKFSLVLSFAAFVSMPVPDAVTHSIAGKNNFYSEYFPAFRIASVLRIGVGGCLPQEVHPSSGRGSVLLCPLAGGAGGALVAAQRLQGLLHGSRAVPSDAWVCRYDGVLRVPEGL